MITPQITVLITTYNYGCFIEQAIDSVLSQDFPPERIQVLVVDDGSTDDTSQRVEKFGSRVECFYKPNGGQASALNFGIAKARGEIIALLDADDLFLPGKLARIADAFQKDATLGMVYHRLQEWHVRTGDRCDYKFVPVSGDMRTMHDQFLLYDPQPTSAVSFRRTSLKPLLPIPESIRMLADCFLVSLIPFLSPILAMPESLAVYRIHGKNSYSTLEQQVPLETRERRLRQWRIVFEAMREWLANCGYTKNQPTVRSFLDRWVLRFQEEQFLIDAPSRFRFFIFLIQQNYAYRGLQTWRLTLLNYLCAPSALIFGYRNAERFYEWRRKAMKAFQPLFRGFPRESE